MEDKNILNMPYSDSGNRMLSYVTNGFYDKSYIAKWIYQVIGQELDEAKIKIDDVANQFFIDTATWGLAYHEEKWGLPIRDNLSYEERRKLIYKKINTRQSNSPFVLEQSVKTIANCDCRICDINDNAYNKTIKHPNLFYVVLTPDNTQDLNIKAIKRILNEKKQSHTEYILDQYLAFLFYIFEKINLEHLIIKTESNPVLKLNAGIFLNNVYLFEINNIRQFIEEDLYSMYFDGKHLLDGKYKLDAFLIVNDAHFKNKYVIYFETKEKFENAPGGFIFNNKTKNKMYVVSKSVNKISINNTIENLYDYKEKRKKWIFNGEFKLNGKRKLNSVFKEEKNGF